MGDSKLVIGLKFAEKLSSKKIDSKKDFQELITVLLEAIQEIECCLDGHINNTHRTKLKLCLLQIQYTINRMSEILTNSSYQKKTIILKLLNKKIYLCLKETLNLFNDETLPTLKNNDLSYHALMSNVLSALASPQSYNNLNSFIDNLLCGSLTIAKLSTHTDFKDINACCKNILNTFSSLKEDPVLNCDEDDLNFSHLHYQVECLERKVNTAMLRLFLHIMSYPQGALKKLIKKCGSSSKLEKFSEDLDDEITDFDLTCDRIALIGNFAIKSCEQESLRIKVQNCLANLEFCEESLVPACIDFYLEPNSEKREFLKYLSSEWKSEVLLLSSLLDSIVDPATFSLVVFEDLINLIQNIKTSEDCRERLFQDCYQRCMKLNENISKSPDCLADSFLVGLNKSLVSALKTNESKNPKTDDSMSKIHHLEIILSLVDQISEHLNKILNCTLGSNTIDFTHSTLKNLSLKNSGTSSSTLNHQNITLVSKEWDVRCQEKYLENNFVPSSYLEKAQMCSPFAFTMYQKTPVRKKFRDNVALTLDVSKNLGQSFDA